MLREDISFIPQDIQLMVPSIIDLLMNKFNIDNLKIIDIFDLYKIAYVAS